MNLELRKVLLYAIIPALIAGAFSFAPKLYDILMEPHAELAYELALGPNLTTSAATQRIGAVEISNAGRKPLSSISISLTIRNSKVVAFQAQIDPALKGSSKLINEHAVISEVPALLPGESFSISFMLTGERDDSEVDVIARSAETLGVKAKKQEAKKAPLSELLGSILAGLSVFFMVILGILGKGPVERIAGLGSKQDSLYYIVARLRIPEIENELRLSASSLTYLRMADILLAFGLKDAGDSKKTAVVALKCLLLIRLIAVTSQEVIIRNIEILEADDFSKEEVDLLRKRAVGVTNVLEFRAAVDNFIDSPLVFLTNDDL